jgi:hypothetical protein
VHDAAAGSEANVHSYLAAVIHETRNAAGKCGIDDGIALEAK